ncbi:MAG: choice-of-anchor B family protein, partial [Calditrichaeota bacterium]
MKSRNFLLLMAVLVTVVPGNAPMLAQGSPNVPLLSQMNLYPAAGYNDCWGYTAPDGREYALLGVQTGTSVVDITDPANPVEVAFIPSATSLWKDIKTYQHYAYVVTEAGGGMQILDLSGLPNTVTELTPYTGFQTSHNIYVDVVNGMLYAEGDFGEPVRVLSLADPEHPVQIAAFGIECHDVFVQDNRAYVAEGGSGSIGIFDVTNPANPTLLQRLIIPNAGYVHNCWVTADNHYMMTTEETNGKTIKYWDISN